MVNVQGWFGLPVRSLQAVDGKAGGGVQVLYGK
jgi:hypothetical protein